MPPNLLPIALRFSLYVYPTLSSLGAKIPVIRIFSCLALLMMESKKEEDGSSVDGRIMHLQKRRRRRTIACCCGSTVATVIVLVLVCVILAVTVFKARNPKVTINSVKLDQFHLKIDPLGLKVELNVSLDLNVSVKNPNKAGFKFGNSTTELYYRGTNVGEALIPAGKLEAGKTMKMNTTVNIDGDRIISNSHLLGDALSGVLPLSSYARVSGRVNVLHIFKHHAVSSSFCNMSIIISNGTIQNEHCVYNVRL